jgi:CheY-like chemotaxis protein
VLLVSRRPPIIDQVFHQLQGSTYRLAVARSMAEAADMVLRLKPLFVLVCQSFSTAEAAVLRPSIQPAATGNSPRLWRLGPASKAVGAGAEPGEDCVEIAALRSTLDRWAAFPGGTSPQPSTSSLTLLLLPCPDLNPPPDPLPQLNSEVRTWLQHYHCRLLQVDDLDQARVLSRVWQPDAMLIDMAPPTADPYWQKLVRYPDLAKLPLVALSRPSTLPAPMNNGLRLYYCSTWSPRSPQKTALELIQTIETILEQ